MVRWLTDDGDMTNQQTITDEADELAESFGEFLDAGTDSDDHYCYAPCDYCGRGEFAR